MSSLHILNGTATLDLFRKSGIKGEVVVWNEILSEGPTLVDIASEDFRSTRQTYTAQAFMSSGYDDIVWGIWNVLNSGQPFDEIICWYEYDLFCQVNFMAMIHWLSENRPDGKLSIVCSGLNDSDRLVGLGERAPDEYNSLLKQKVTLTNAQKKEASQVWKCYCSEQHDQLLHISQRSSLPYLHEALAAHVRRFPWTTDGLSEHQRMILSWVKEGVTSQRQLVGKCLRNNGYYGFGDLQYFNMIDTLDSYIDWENEALSELGMEAIDGSINPGALPTATTYGGASTASFKFDPDLKHLTPCQ